MASVPFLLTHATDFGTIWFRVRKATALIYKLFFSLHTGLICPLRLLQIWRVESHEKYFLIGLCSLSVSSPLSADLHNFDDKEGGSRFSAFEPSHHKTTGFTVLQSTSTWYDCFVINLNIPYITETCSFRFCVHFTRRFPIKVTTLPIAYVYTFQIEQKRNLDR